MHSHKIDPALRERRAVLELLHRIDAADMTFAQLEAVAEELAGAGPQAATVLALEIGKTEDLERLNRLTFLAAYLDDDRLIESLSRLLFHPHRSRAYKAQILQALERLGVDTDSRFYRKIFPRNEIIRLNLDELLRRMENHAEAPVQFLYDSFYASHSQRLATASLLIQRGGDTALGLAALLAEIAEPATWEFIIQELGRQRSAESARTLQSICTYTVVPAMEQEARKALRRLRFAGLVIAGKETSGSLDAENELSDKSAALVSWASRVEGNGTQLIWLARPASPPAEDLADTVCFLLHESRGIIDCFGEVRTSLRDFVENNVQAEDGGVGRLVPMAYARTLIEQALAMMEQQGVPLPPELPFRLRRLGLEKLRPSPAAAAPIYAEALESVGQADWDALCGLFREPVLEDWIIDDPEFFQRASALREQPRVSRVEMERFVRRTFHDFIVPNVADLQQRLLRNEDWLRISDGDTKIADRLRAAAQTLERPDPDNNLFVRQFITKSLHDVQELVREGYDPSWLFDDDDDDL
jgi:hypothetical protein